MITDVKYALTLYQPWASLLLAKWADDSYIKATETRSWKPAHPEQIGWVAIHAAKTDTSLKGFVNRRDQWLLKQRVDSLAAVDPAYELESVFNKAWDRLPDHRFPTGCLIGVACLLHCDAITFPYAEEKRLYRRSDYLFGDYSLGRFGWTFGPRRFLPNPIVAVGARKLWRLSAKQEFEVFSQVGGFLLTEYPVYPVTG